MLLEDQVPPVVAEDNCVVNPEHTFVAPVIAAIVGNGFTVTVVAADVAGQPLAFVTVTEYVPDNVAFIDCEVAPFDHT